MKLSLVCLSVVLLLLYFLIGPSTSASLPRSREGRISALKTLRQNWVARQRARRASSPSLSSSLSASASASASVSVSTGTPNTENIFVTDYGADPTGKKDSSAAFTLAFAEAWKRAQNRTFTGISYGNMPDLGGVVVDLSGGQYLLSSPVKFPKAAGGNLVVSSGSLFASSTFPSGGYLFDLTSGYYIDITFQHLLFDSAHRGGGLHISSSLRILVFDCYFVHYSNFGLNNGGGVGHELLVDDSFFGEFEWGEKGYDDRKYQTGAAIGLFNNDNHVRNSVIFCGKDGVINNGAANEYVGLHIYTTCGNLMSLDNGNNAIRLTGNSWQIRIEQVYIDFSLVVVEAPNVITITSSFFLGSAKILLVPTKPNSTLSGLSIVGNQFDQACVELQEAKGNSFDHLQIFDTVVEDNMYCPVTTRFRGAQRLVDSNKWAFNLSRSLLFDKVQHLTYSFALEKLNPNSLFPQTALVWSNHSTAFQVLASDTLTGTVSVVADQSLYSYDPKNNFVGDDEMSPEVSAARDNKIQQN